MVGGNSRWWGKNLLCANAKTHDKVCVYRALRKNARQILCLSRVNAKTYGKHFFGRALFHGASWKIAPLCRAPEKMRTANIRAHGKYGVSRSDFTRACTHITLICLVQPSVEYPARIMLLHTNKPNHDASKLTKLFYIIDATSFD
jgi:hypothetical protein